MATFIVTLGLYIINPPEMIDAYMAFSGGRYYNEVLVVTECMPMRRHSLHDFCEQQKDRFKNYKRWFCVRTEPKWSYTECQAIKGAKVRRYSRKQKAPFKSVVEYFPN